MTDDCELKQRSNIVDGLSAKDEVQRKLLLIRATNILPQSAFRAKQEPWAGACLSLRKGKRPLGFRSIADYLQ